MRPRKTKIGPEVAHVTRDSDTTFKVKRSKVNLHGAGILCRPPAQFVITVSQKTRTPKISHNSLAQTACLLTVLAERMLFSCLQTMPEKFDIG